MDMKDFLNEVNDAYYQLEMKQAQITHALLHRIFEIESGWYNSHYHKGESGEWHRESYPIPVVTVKGLCDIEISFDEITVSTKLKRAKALEYSYDKVFRAFVANERQGQNCNRVRPMPQSYKSGRIIPQR